VPASDEQRPEDAGTTGRTIADNVIYRDKPLLLRLHFFNRLGRGQDDGFDFPGIWRLLVLWAPRLVSRSYVDNFWFLLL